MQNLWPHPDLQNQKLSFSFSHDGGVGSVLAYIKVWACMIKMKLTSASPEKVTIFFVISVRNNQTFQEVLQI